MIVINSSLPRDWRQINVLYKSVTIQTLAISPINVIHNITFIKVGIDLLTQFTFRETDIVFSTAIAIHQTQEAVINV